MLRVNLILLGLFGCVTCVEYDQSQSDLPAVPGDIPDGATQVVLRGNEIRALGDGNFSALTYCTYIDLGENSISVIQPRSFRGLARLFTLELDGNKLTEVKSHMFQNLTQLTYLLLQSNLIKSIEVDSFESLVNFKQLHLAWNVLDELRAAMFNGLRSIRLINLDGNKLTSIDSSTFSDLPRPLELALDFNPLVCDGRLCWLKEEEQQGNITWLIWDEHLYKPNCSGDVTWDAWVCPEASTVSSHPSTTQDITKSSNETTNDTLVLVLAVLGAFLAGIVVSVAVGIIFWKRSRTKNSRNAAKPPDLSRNGLERDTSHIEPDMTYEVLESPPGGRSPHNVDYTSLYDKPKQHSYLEINDEGT